MSNVKLLVATPIDGLPASAKVAYGHVLALSRLLNSSIETKLLDPGLMGYPSDLVRARSRAVSAARSFGATHILWLDDDNIPKPGAITRMIDTGHDMIGCPYARKRIHWERFRDPANWAGDDAERIAYDYAYHHTDGEEGRRAIQVVDGCIPVQRISMGCMLTSMRALDAMTEHYREELWFTDVVEGSHWDCVALFQLMLGKTVIHHGVPFRPLYSEDYSLCQRYQDMRDAGCVHELGPVQMLVSHPADHVGTHLFRGLAEGLVYAR